MCRRNFWQKKERRRRRIIIIRIISNGAIIIRNGANTICLPNFDYYLIYNDFICAIANV
jgi:hypothetical protein